MTSTAVPTARGKRALLRRWITHEKRGWGVGRAAVSALAALHAPRPTLVQYPSPLHHRHTLPGHRGLPIAVPRSRPPAHTERRMAVVTVARGVRHAVDHRGHPARPLGDRTCFVVHDGWLHSHPAGRRHRHGA